MGVLADGLHLMSRRIGCVCVLDVGLHLMCSAIVVGCIGCSAAFDLSVGWMCGCVACGFAFYRFIVDCLWVCWLLGLHLMFQWIVCTCVG